MLVSAGEAGGAGARPGSGQSSTTPAIADSTITEIPANARRRDAPVTHAAAPTPPAKTAHPPDRNTAGMGVRAARPTDAPAPATAASTSRPTKPATRAASAIVRRTARRQYYAAHVRRITPNSRERPGAATTAMRGTAATRAGASLGARRNASHRALRRRDAAGRRLRLPRPAQEDHHQGARDGRADDPQRPDHQH